MSLDKSVANKETGLGKGKAERPLTQSSQINQRPYGNKTAEQKNEGSE